MAHVTVDRGAFSPSRGDLVWLASGSPPLAVYRLRDDGYVEVEWFADAEVRRDCFHVDCLRKSAAETSERNP